MATTDTTIAHIMHEQEDINIKASKCWNLIRPPAALLISNGRRICTRPLISARIGLICTGKINNPWRVITTHRKIGPTTALSVERNSGFIRWYQSFRCSPYSKCLPRHRYIQPPLGCLVESVYVTIPLALGYTKSLELFVFNVDIFTCDNTWQVTSMTQISGLQESNENTMTRFFKGLNSNIQARLVNVTYNHIGQLFMLACNVERKILENPTEQQAMRVPPIADVLQEVQNNPQNEKNDMFEMSLPSLANEEKADAPTLSEEGIKGKLNGAEITQGEYASDELHFSTFHADLEQTLVEPTSELPLSQVGLHSVPCDKEELCDSTSLISIPQLVNEHATFNIDSPCTEFKHVIHISSENDELQLQSSLNTLGYILFDDSCELNYLKAIILTHSDLPCPRNVIFHIFGKYNDSDIYLVHKVYIRSDMQPSVVVPRKCKLESSVRTTDVTSSLFCFCPKTQVGFEEGEQDLHHMEKPRTVFREEGEDDVTMATTDTTIAHIMHEQEDINIKASKCWNLIRPPAALLISNGRRICTRPLISARIGLICTGKINNPRRGVSIAKAQHNVSYGCSRIVNVSPKS
uniref:Retrotransposon protein, putative, Ty3-gypsy sub-class n=2 Tax=Oryza sativa subsp. japonica TaxID=39947 RepID=Q2R5V6_ORYSJ|nr:retrotransposon protein, putative, Ty3-gypsy sub-class [Oryza sativa Japonica Group]ABA93108.1 retrotransposon, putative, centromere-specific [Oryza sativa Japonica Group]